MYVGMLKIQLRAEWCHSLKERRMVARSVVGRLRSHFNAAVLEEPATSHQIIDLAVAALGHTAADAQAMLEKMLAFVEGNTDAVVIQAEKEIF